MAIQLGHGQRVVEGLPCRDSMRSGCDDGRRFESGACSRPYSICASMSRYLTTRAHHQIMQHGLRFLFGVGAQKLLLMTW